MRQRLTSPVLILIVLVVLSSVCQAASKVKIRGYITARPDAQTIQILDDLIALESATQFEMSNAAAGQKMALTDLSLGVLIEAEGVWTGRHRFAAAKITCDADQFDKQIHSRAYLDREPPDAPKLSSGESPTLQADGEILMLRSNAQRSWPPVKPAAAEATGTRLVGRQVRYEGVRSVDGRIEVDKLEWADPPPADAYKIPDNITVVLAKDRQTGIDILEFRKGEKKVEGRMKLFPVKEVQDYVTELGHKLLPPSADVTARALEFRFFLVEDPHINAAALPDGTVLINTGLLGAMDNEAQLAFVMSHEIAHVLQAHHWREVHETRSQRVLITIAAVAASAYVGDVALFLGQLGMATIVNGYSRNIENQADRLGLQNIIELGYDPRPAVGFFNTMVDRYSDRSTSALWSSHDSSLLRGSFVTVQLQREFPDGRFDKAVVNTNRFQAMKEAMGPVKIM